MLRFVVFDGYNGSIVFRNRTRRSPSSDNERYRRAGYWKGLSEMECNQGSDVPHPKEMDAHDRLQ